MRQPQITTGIQNGPLLDSLEAIEMNRKFKKFKAASLEEYETKVKQMSASDLFAHAMEVGIRASTDRRQAIASLVKLFQDTQKNVNRYKRREKKEEIPAYAKNSFLDNY